MDETVKLGILIEAKEAAQDVFNRLHGATHQLAGAFTNAENKAKSLGAELLNHLKNAVLNPVAAAVAGLGAVVGTAFEWHAALKATTDLGEQVYKMTKIFGLSAEGASKWIYVGKMVGLEADQLAKGFKIFAKHLEETSLHMLNKGTPSANVFAEELKKLGVNAFDSRKHIRNFDDVLLDVADRFAKLPANMDKAGIAMNLFGKSGTDLVPILELGRKGIVDLQNEAQKYGLVITTQNLPAIHQYIELHRQLDAAQQGLQLTIGQGLIPIQTMLTQKTIEVVQAFRGWINQHPEVVASLQNLAKAGIDFVGRALAGLAQAINGPQGGAIAGNPEGLLSKAERAGKALGGPGPDSLAGAVSGLSDKFSTFLNSKSTADFVKFWKNLGANLQDIANTLKNIANFNASYSGPFLGSTKGSSPGAAASPPGGAPPFFMIPDFKKLLGHQAGAYIPRDEVAYLHAGERVLNRGQNQQWERGGAAVFQITINGNVDSQDRVRQLGTEFERQRRLMGGRTLSN